MKPLNLKETALLEEMKDMCLNNGDYIDENAKARFYMLCHLEDFEVQYWELHQENKQLKDNWVKLKEYIRKNIIYDDVGMKILDPSPLEDYMQELERSDSNE